MKEILMKREDPESKFTDLSRFETSIRRTELLSKYLRIDDVYQRILSIRINP
jgi:hypothetical protein